MILKIVGYAEQVAQYYRLEDFKAHVWIAHQRYPTKGRVWHPGGAHPFIGMNEALVHNGDFANYYSRVRVPGQRNIYPPVPDRHRGRGAALRPLAPGLRLSAGVHHRGLGPHHGAGLRSPAPENKQASTGPIQATHIHGSPGRPLVLHHRPEATRITGSFSSSASPTPPCSGPRSSPSRTARCRSA